MCTSKRNTGTGERTRLGLALEKSAKEILAHVKGETTRHTRVVVLPKEVDGKRLRWLPITR
jgi:hypothetical protein